MIMLPISEVIYFPETICVIDYFDLAEKHLHTRYPHRSKRIRINAYLIWISKLHYKETLSSDNLQKFIQWSIHKILRNIMQVLKGFKWKKKCHLAIIKNEKEEFIGMVLEISKVIEITDRFDNRWKGTTHNLRTTSRIFYYKYSTVQMFSSVSAGVNKQLNATPQTWNHFTSNFKIGVTHLWY
jgi:hypothetical protein